MSRHIQVLRLQPGDPIVLFDSGDHEWLCNIVEIERRSVLVEVTQRIATRRELPLKVQIALGMPANDRMDALIEKATELGAASVQPLVCQRSVLRLEGERAAKRVAHWSSVAISSSEQSGRTCPTRVCAVALLADWLASWPRADDARPHIGIVLSTGDAPHLSALLTRQPPLSGETAAVALLSGPEGGLSPEEEAAAVGAGFLRASLGPRTLRADTAPVAALALIAAYCDSAASRFD